MDPQTELTVIDVYPSHYINHPQEDLSFHIQYRVRAPDQTDFYVLSQLALPLKSKLRFGDIEPIPGQKNSYLLKAFRRSANPEKKEEKKGYQPDRFGKTPEEIRRIWEITREFCR